MVVRRTILEKPGDQEWIALEAAPAPAGLPPLFASTPLDIAMLPTPLLDEGNSAPVSIARKPKLRLLNDDEDKDDEEDASFMESKEAKQSPSRDGWINSNGTGFIRKTYGHSTHAQKLHKSALRAGPACFDDDDEEPLVQPPRKKAAAMTPTLDEVSGENQRLPPSDTHVLACRASWRVCTTAILCGFGWR
jgi:hypothetical protein